MTRAAVQAPRALRITDQVRTTRGYAYDLAIEERRLTVRIEEIPAAGGFRVEARARDRASSDEQSAKADARSRGATLRAVGRPGRRSTGRRSTSTGRRSRSCWTASALSEPPRSLHADQLDLEDQMMGDNRDQSADSR